MFITYPHDETSTIGVKTKLKHLFYFGSDGKKISF